VTSRPIRVKGRTIGAGSEPFVIAEMSGNHNGSLDRALEIVSAVAAAGAHALKLQTYSAASMTLDIDREEFLVSDPENLWYGKTLYSLYEEAATPREWHRPIFDRCEGLGLIGFSTPFDASAVDFLEDLNVPCYKIASFEIVDLALIKKVASTGKPLIISTGLATVDEISDAVQAARSAGCSDLVLLKCTSSYPADPRDSNLATIQDIRERFECEVGLSDHTLGIGVAIAAVALGASVIEKHVTLRRADGGVDSAFSLEPEELESLVAETKRAYQATGRATYEPTSSETRSRIFRRSLYVVNDIGAGDVLTSENLRAIRPGYGLAPKHLDELLGRRVSRPVRRGTPMSWDLLA
jgi:N-acetylneuraminate synthase